jgi:predicted transcriptional regulator
MRSGSSRVWYLAIPSGVAMTLRLSEADDRLLTERARSEGRSKQEVAREAIHGYLTDQVRRIEDLEDELAMARYQLRKQLGEVSYVSQAEARASLGLPPARRRSTSA